VVFQTLLHVVKLLLIGVESIPDIHEKIEVSLTFCRGCQFPWFLPQVLSLWC